MTLELAWATDHKLVLNDAHFTICGTIEAPESG